ncbi:alpha-amylase family glycosyl hydrolase [Verrucomicrobia bacterium]|jgi:starch synthase (maltosyl-transferring)|nr:alpha-amylase family glycosyl hydrolase [Verrucomicrobiota bacterium]MDA7667715.1 alpha-amylase family glycosyl hydrolase [bacterium]
MTIYNLFPLLAGRFHEWPPHLRRAAEMGFDWVFVNPIQYSGFSGSLYSISDYFRWHPLLVDEEKPEDPFLQSRSVIECGEGLGLRFMVDLVINHCAFDSALLREHPEWFEWEGDEVVHPFCYDGEEKVVWGDLAKFRYHDNQDLEHLIQFWVSVVGFLVEQGFRGFRCDAAYQVPSSVWSALISETKALYPEIVFVAETLGCRPEQTLDLARAGFDFIQNSSKWWDFRSDWLMEQYSQTNDVVDSIGFPESHDTPRLACELNGSENGMKQRYLFTALFSAGVMMPVGFEFAFRKPLNVVTTRSTDWESPSLDLCSFIRAVNGVRKRSRTFQKDVSTRLLENSNPNVLMMLKHDPDSGDLSLLILNKDSENYQPFWCENLYRELPSKRPLVDVSPEFRLDFLPAPFEYSLRPGQGIVLVN